MLARPRAAPRFGRLPTYLLWVLLIVAALLLLGAAILALSEWIDGGGKTEMTFTASDTGKSISIAPDDEFVVRLPSNATTGYRWAVDTLDVNVVTYLGSTYEAPNGGLVGQGGTEELRFRALTTGETQLKLKYWQPWGGDASTADTFDLTVYVAE